MGIAESVATGLVIAFLIFSILRLFTTPLRLLGRFLLRGACGLGALSLLSATAPLTGITLGVNLFNAAAIGLLGAPGLALLLLLQKSFI